MQVSYIYKHDQRPSEGHVSFKSVTYNGYSNVPYKHDLTVKVIFGMNMT